MGGEFSPDTTRPYGRVLYYSGFTLVELIVTIAILGVIATIAGSKFFSSSSFNEMGFSDTAANSFKYAHKLAIATGCETRAQITATSIALYQRASSCTSGSFTRQVTKPGGGDFLEPVPPGVAVSTLDIYFDSTGRPYSHASGSVLMSAVSFNVGSRSVTIEAETGYVH